MKNCRSGEKGGYVMKLSTRSKFIIPLVSEKIKELNTPIEFELN